MKFLLLTCATAHEEWAQIAVEKYREKIQPFVSFDVKNLKSRGQARSESNLKNKLDSDQILSEIEDNDFVVLFDERGQQLSSLLFSKKLNSILQSGKKRVVWVIGGSFGVDERVRQRAQLTLSLSPFILNHLVAQTVVLEQIFRGFSILKNLPYHNE